MSASGIAALLGLDTAALAWQADGACLNMDPDLWFPGRGESHKPAKAVCAGCPVREQCLDYALEHHINFGVWGGTTEKERRRLRRARLAESAAA